MIKLNINKTSTGGSGNKAVYKPDAENQLSTQIQISNTAAKQFKLQIKTKPIKPAQQIKPILQAGNKTTVVNNNINHNNRVGKRSAIKLNLGQAQKQEIIKPKRDILFGSGATKKVANSLQSAINKEAKKYETNIAIQTPKITEIKKATISHIETLPSALMDDSITLDHSQIAAVEGLINQKYGCLIGGAGKGKTTTIKAIIARMEEENLLATDGSVVFCSFTGKAVQQIKRALPEKYHSSCNTIHSTLGFKPVMVEKEIQNEFGLWETVERMQFLPEYDAMNQLSCKFVIIDEAGTVSLTLWHYFIAALPEDCRIMLLGDLNQLAPVAGHSILGFAMLKWPTYELTVLHRNAGAIAANANRVTEGKKPLTDEIDKKVLIKKIEDGSMAARKSFLGIIKYLHDNDKFDPLLDAIIVPQNIDALGQEELNTVLVNQFNPQRKDKETNKIINPRHSVRAGNQIKSFAVGDKLMLLKNNNEAGLTNGMQGIIVEIAINNNFQGTHVKEIQAHANITVDLASLDAHLDAISNKADEPTEELLENERAASHIITIQFQDVKELQIFGTVGEITNLTLSYVFTAHKSQGSEFRFVIVLCHSANKRMLCREWLYTAMTRAKNSLLIVCNNRGLTQAVNTQRIKGVTLKEKALKFIAMAKDKKGEETAQLPEPETIIAGKLQFKTTN